MSKTIELNGKHYDAVTGSPVKIEVRTTPKVKNVTTPAKRGVVQKRRKPQSSKTLMRSSVKRPAVKVAPPKVATTKVKPTYVEIPVKKAPEAAAHKAHARPNVFEQAISGANHHRDVHREVRRHKKKVRSSRVQLGAGLAGLLLLAGFAAYQNTPGMQLKVAGIRAGVATASNPDVASAGFAFSGVHADGSKRVVALKDDNGNEYQLLQEKTNWSEDDMINALGSNDLSGVPNYDVVSGDTSQIYRFTNGTVTWINNGQLYQLDNSGDLSDSQLLSLASSS